MNTKDKTIFFHVARGQGLIYFFGGMIILFFRCTEPSRLSPFTPNYSVGIVGGLLLGIGYTLYTAKGRWDQPAPIYYLGFISSATLLISQLVSPATSLLLHWVDVLLQTLFTLVWTYLLYWRWIVGEFQKLSSRRNRK
nr:hypothetical protein [Cytophagales bacterium]